MPYDQSVIDSWKLRAGRAGGTLWSWMGQAKDDTLLQANSPGVCAAIVTQCASEVKTRPTIVEFANSFRHGIPATYLDRQAAYRSAHQLNVTAEASSIERYVDQADEVSADFRQALVETYILRKRLRFGPDCVEYRQFEANPSGADLDAIFGTMDASSPNFYGFSMSGHRVGFGCRPDWINASAPHGRFLFVDANLGLVIFNRPEHMFGFFKDTLWQSPYRDKYGTATLTWGRYPMANHQRRVSEWEQTTIDTMLTERVQAEEARLMAELEELMRELEAEDSDVVAAIESVGN